MKIKGLYLCAAVLLLTGCSAKPTEDAATESDEMLVVTPDEDFDKNYAEAIKTYFEALENKDFESYKSIAYQPYQEAFDAFLSDNDSNLEKAFQEVCTEFDEDGYESWKLTELNVKYCEKEDVDNFFSTYEQAGIFDEDFSDAARKDAKEIRDIEFTLYALYSGDEEATPVVQSSEMMVIHAQDDKYYVFA